MSPDSSATAFRRDEDGSKKKKKRKRSENTAEDANAADPEARKKSKKKKRSHPDESVQTTQAIAEQTREPPTVAPEMHSCLDIDSQIDSQLVAGSSSTTTLLSAIVAAATGVQPNAPQDELLHPSLIGQFPYCSASPSGFPDFNNVPLSDAVIGSNELVLRALQDLDISKIANVLKTLEEAAAAANVQLPQHLLPNTPAPVGQRPVSSDTIMTMAENKVSTIGGKIPNENPVQFTSEDHAHILATKWLESKKLNELVETQGLVYKKGKFSAIEEHQVKSAIENYRISRGVSEEQLDAIIFPKNDRGRDNAFWSEITSAVPQRPIIAVYHYVRRAFHPLKQQGKWMPAEDDRLNQSVASLGQQWEKISHIVGRRATDCRDRYRNHLADKSTRASGPWTAEEEEELTHIVTQMTLMRGRDIDDEVFWGKVSDQMGGRRNRQQCRIKWTDCLAKVVKNDGEKTRWSTQDAYILVHKIDSLHVRDDTEIDWKTIPDARWNLWSAHVLQRRWHTMKKSIKGHEHMPLQDIIDILKQKKVLKRGREADSSVA